MVSETAPARVAAEALRRPLPTFPWVSFTDATGDESPAGRAGRDTAPNGGRDIVRMTFLRQRTGVRFEMELAYPASADTDYFAAVVDRASGCRLEVLFGTSQTLWAGGYYVRCGDQASDLVRRRGLKGTSKRNLVMEVAYDDVPRVLDMRHELTGLSGWTSSTYLGQTVAEADHAETTLPLKAES
jgi:hypothetical protein